MIEPPPVTGATAQAGLAADDSARWAACLARDRTADGHFFFGVRTTGVFCRPSCGARRPRRENVRFYEDAAAARAAGLRPCRRCDPEGDGQDSRDAALIERACRALERASTHVELAALARSAGLSRFHFHRLFRRVTGMTPAAYQRARRAEHLRARLQEVREVDEAQKAQSGRQGQTGRKSLTGRGSGSITDAIYAAGYGSSGRFYAGGDATLGMSARHYRRGGEGSTIRFSPARCWLGGLLVAATERGVCAVLFGDDPRALQSDLHRRFPRAQLVPGDRRFARLVSRVIAALERPALASRLPLDLQGTLFQRRVWQALRGVPAGTTVSYAEVARRVGRPRAVRAVGQAIGANPIAVAVPCHRIIRSDGSLCGYHWGVRIKRSLLEREARQARRR